MHSEPFLQLAAGATDQELPVGLALPTNVSAGTYYILTTASPVSGETNPFNNTVATAITIWTPPPTGAPDLVAQNVLISDSSLSPGDTFILDYSILYQGIANSSETESGAYLSTDSNVTTSDIFLGSQFAGNLPPGASAAQSIPTIVPENLNDGTYYIAVIADDLDREIEANEMNNTSNALVVSINTGNIPVTPPSNDPPTILNNGNSNVNIDGNTSTFVDFGGQDTYTLLSSLNADVEITDNNPSTINLPEGIAITSALFLADGAQFTINGNTVTLLGDPASFDFIFGGTPLDPNAGSMLTFAQTASAFGTSIPAQGAVPNAANIVGTVQPDGTLGGASLTASLIGLPADGSVTEYF